MATWTRSGRASRHRRHDPAELRRLIRRRDSEGISYAKLARESGIPAGTLAWWAHRLRREEGPPAAAAGFVEVIPTGDSSASDDIEVRLPGGVVIQAPSTIDRPTMLRLLSAILSC